MDFVYIICANFIYENLEISLSLFFTNLFAVQSPLSRYRELYFSHILSIIIFVHHEFRQENTICNMEIYSSTFNTRRHIDESFCNMKIPIYTINCNIDFCIIRLSTSLLLLSSSSTIIINRKQNFYL